MTSIFTFANQDLEKFDPKQAVEIFRQLLWAKARNVGVPLSRVHISSWINVPDGGVDARIDADEMELDGLPQRKANGSDFRFINGVIKATPIETKVDCSDYSAVTRRAVFHRQIFIASLS